MKLITMLVIELLAYAESTIACLAEFGPQQLYMGLKAGADLRGQQYCAMRLTTTAATVNLASEVAGVAGVGKVGIGVLQNKPNTNEAATVAYLGMSKWVAGGTVTVNQMVTYNSSGKCVDAVSGDIVMGRALEGATVDGQVVGVMLSALPPVRYGSIA